MKTVSVREMMQQGVSKSIRESEQEPILVRKSNEPVTWLISHQALQRVAAVSGRGDVFERALQLQAVTWYEQAVLTLSQAAALAGMSLEHFIDFCDRLHVPVLWEPDKGIAAEVDAFDAWLEDAKSQHTA